MIDRLQTEQDVTEMIEGGRRTHILPLAPNSLIHPQPLQNKQLSFLLHSQRSHLNPRLRRKTLQKRPFLHLSPQQAAPTSQPK